MWDRALREATRHCASHWGHNLGKGRVKILLVGEGRGGVLSLAVFLRYGELLTEHRKFSVIQTDSH